MRIRANVIALLVPVLLSAAQVFGGADNGARLPASAVNRQYFWIYIEEDPSYAGRGSRTYSPAERALDRRRRRGSLSPEQYQHLDRVPADEYLRRIRDTGAEVRHVSRWLQAVSVKATRTQVESLAMLPFVKEVAPVRQLRRAPTSAWEGETRSPRPALAKMDSLNYGQSFGQLDMLNIPAVHQLGYSGQGVIVLIMDTGFYKEHEAFRPDRIIAEYDFVSNDTNTQNETLEDSLADQHSHGTRVWSVLGGYSPGRLIGSAYGCSFLLAKTEINEYDAIIEEDNFVAALEWGEALGADIISSSIGYLYWYSYEDLDGQTAITTQAIRWATRTGMLAVVAMGNERQDAEWGGYMTVPADADSIIAVGAITESGFVASFSSHGPTYDGRIKPELVALGLQVSCAATWDTAGYTVSNGTSFSTPLVAGGAALLLEAHPNWSPMDIRNAMLATASRAGSPNNDYGWGVPDILAALYQDPAAIEMEGGGTTEEQLLRITNIYPNPLRSNGQAARLTIQWTGAGSAPISLGIYNLLGQHILDLYPPQGGIPSFRGIAIWHGKDAAGRILPSGVYVVRLTTARLSATKPLTIIQ